MSSLKPFVINLNDLAFLLEQVNFVPLFDAQGNAVVNWTGATAIYDTHGVLLSSGSSNPAQQALLVQQFGRIDPVTGAYVAGFPDVSAPIGIRDVTGFHNNLYGTQADWGAVDVPFVRQMPADYSNYVTTAGANYDPDSITGLDVVDLMPRIISRTITTGGVNLLTDGGQYVEWNHVLYESASGPSPSQAALDYKALIDGSGVDITQLVEGAKIVAPVTTTTALDSLSWDPTAYSASNFYRLGINTLAATLGDGHIYGSATGGAPADGATIYTFDGTSYLPLTVGGVELKLDVASYVYKSLVDALDALDTGFNRTTAAPGATIHIPTDYNPSPVGDVDPDVILSTVQTSSGYGLLEQIGHIDFQNPTSGEYFIGSENPGVAPVNSWFGIFGQFFDHGLDFIGKGGSGTITIALSPGDPLYNEAPNHAITISRATPSGVDANGDAAYKNHTSPFIDQSQTYGSNEQITSILREWVSTDGNTTYHAGMELFDGTTLADPWTRKLPVYNATTGLFETVETQVHNTLPTLSELRAHLLATGRDDITWEDVSNLRNRDLVTGDVITSGPGAGNSGHALILDMNPHFDGVGSAGAGHITQQAIAAFNAQFGTTYTTDNFSVSAVLPYVNPDFSIQSSLNAAQHAAVGEILMQSVGDHYIAGDGRVNENFGLTSIHHVFHEEHNYQVENLKTWIYAHDANNPGSTAATLHEQLHNWQDSVVTRSADTLASGVLVKTASGSAGVKGAAGTHYEDAKGNYVYANGEVAWNADKMFDATKLIVEMEYQHAAVDQYARTVTPRIQEFVGYSTGVDSTISLEYAQVAFRFGHSTIRETIDAIDPSGWYSGHVMRYALEQAFLAPHTFAEEGVAAITLGLTHQQMNEVDEFVTPALSQGLLGQPLDLPAINIARGRDLGIPTLNDFRAGIGLSEYTSWDDFGKNMIHPESLVNFIAAYSFADPTGVADIAVSQAKAQYLLDLADGAPELAANDPANPFGVLVTYEQAVAFLTNSPVTGNAELDAARDNFDQIDSWIGGLAEAHVPGGLLGETFDAVFVAQIQALMDGDRFYYLYRLFGTQIHEEVNNGQFKDIVERNTGLEHLNGSIFAYADKYYDFNKTALPANAELHNLANTKTYFTDQYGQLYETRTGAGTLADPYVYADKIDASNPLPAADAALFIGASTTAVNADYASHGYGALLSVEGNTKGIYSDGGASLDPNGSGITVMASDGIRASVTLDLIRDVRPDLHPDLVHPVEGTPTDGADSHEVIVASDVADFIHARSGDDTVYGEGGDDFIYGDGGVDRMYGGDGNDMIDTGEGPDLADGGAGKDIIYGRGSGSEVGGFDQLVGGSGNDLVVGGEGIDKLSSGAGDDIVFGDGLTNPEMGNTDPFTHGGDGNDYIDGGASGDILLGEEGDDYIVGGNDQDLMQGGQGDDIIRPGNPSQASGTTGGPDEVLGDDGQANAGFDLIDFSDYAGSAPGVTVDFATQNNPLVNIDQTTTFPAWFQIEGAIGTRNADTFIGDSDGDATADNSHGNNWLIGGSGNDTFTGAGGNDLIIGGSIRLDALIGKYADAANASGLGNLALGSTEWIADAMHTGASGGTNDGYDNDSENAYTGASNRATGTLSGGFLAGYNAANTGANFDLHFTDMLQSRMFKDVVLGDGGADGTADTAVFTGNLNRYAITALDANGVVVQNPHQSWAQVFAIRVTDNRTANDFVDANGDPLVDANGNPLGNEGTDLIVGVETLKFADQTTSVAAYFDKAPTLDLNYAPTSTTVVSDNFNGNGNAYGRGTGWGNNNNWTESGDNNNSGSGQILVDTAASGQNNNPGLHITGGTPAGSFDGATISRAVTGLTNDQAAQLSFSVRQLGISGSETVKVYLQSTTPTASDTPIYTIQSSADTATTVHDIPVTGPFPAGLRLYFVASAMNATTDDVYIDNISITALRDTDGTGNTASYTEQLAPAVLTTAPRIGDPDQGDQIYSATVHVRETITGDQLTMAVAAPAGITVSGSGTGTLVLTSAAGSTFADFQTALQAVRFSNTGDNPTIGGNTTRHLDVTVNDGLRDSAVATTTVTVTPVDDPSVLANETVITNFGTTPFSIADFAFLSNDSDPDTNLTIGGVNAASSLTATHNINGSITITDTSAVGTNTFRYWGGSVGQNDVARATVTVTQRTGTTLNGTVNADIIIGTDAITVMNGDDGNDVIFGNGGNDTLNGGIGDDTIVYSVTTQGGGNVTSGRDIVDGGANAVINPVGDRFILNGTNGQETFRIFSNTDDWDNNAANGIQSSAAHAGITGLNGNTEIVVTRGGNLTAGVLTGATVLAELDNIEEITVNALNTTANNGNNPNAPDGGSSGGDTISVIGNFTGTSLNYSTITVNGSAGNDTVDISGLTSDHRVVFNSNGGNDAVIGTLRPQDVVDLDDLVLGTTGADRLNGGAGHDWVLGLAGNDRLLGGLGNDTVKGGAGRDVVNGGLGDDILSGGAGRDLFVFREGFGHDVITDFDANPAGGQDKILLRMDIAGDDFAQHVRIVDAGRDTIVRIDGQEIRLAGVADHHSVTVQDFVLA